MRGDDSASHAKGKSAGAGGKPGDGNVPERPDPGAGASSPDPSGDGPARPAAGRDRAPVCDLCGAVMLERHCKIVCPACGYMRDCSDP